MNSIWNENLRLLKERFPKLYQELTPLFQENAPFSIESSKTGDYTAIWNGKPLHSKYNPQREAESAIQSYKNEKEKDYSSAIFLSFGLGYAPKIFAKENPHIPMILIEPDPLFFIGALKSSDFTPIFNHKKLIIFAGAEFETVKSFLYSSTEKNTWVYSSPVQGEHALSYHNSIRQCLKQNSKKEEINTNTLERFGHLWLKNSCKNLSKLDELDGIEKYRNLASNTPVTILAAGPSLQNLLPHLKEIKEKSLLICVDTSVHACIKQGIQPDFIILVDPQYACWRHLEFISCPESILITESAAWPSVFRFNCKEIVLCSSLFPIGKYFESQLGNKGKLGAGGSVTTTAWDFARIIGAKEIFLAGMDLGFPGKQTHIRGSQFEEASHRVSNRTKSPETDNIKSLISANPVLKEDYKGNPLLTDTRMSLFSWWFENNVQQSAPEGVNTYTLTAESLFINGIKHFDISDFLNKPDIYEEKVSFFKKASEISNKIKDFNNQNHKPSFAEVKKSFINNLEELISLSKKALNLCEKALQNRTLALEVSAELNKIDSKILGSKAKDAAALVFPTQKQLEALTKDLPQDKELGSIFYSRVIYTQIQKSAKEYLKYL